MQDVEAQTVTSTLHKKVQASYRTLADRLKDPWYSLSKYRGQDYPVNTPKVSYKELAGHSRFVVDQPNSAAKYNNIEHNGYTATEHVTKKVYFDAAVGSDSPIPPDELYPFAVACQEVASILGTQYTRCRSIVNSTKDYFWCSDRLKDSGLDVPPLQILGTSNLAEHEQQQRVKRRAERRKQASLMAKDQPHIKQEPIDFSDTESYASTSTVSVAASQTSRLTDRVEELEAERAFNISMFIKPENDVPSPALNPSEIELPDIFADQPDHVQEALQRAVFNLRRSEIAPRSSPTREGNDVAESMETDAHGNDSLQTSQVLGFVTYPTFEDMLSAARARALLVVGPAESSNLDSLSFNLKLKEETTNQLRIALLGSTSTSEPLQRSDGLWLQEQEESAADQPEVAMEGEHPGDVSMLSETSEIQSTSFSIPKRETPLDISQLAPLPCDFANIRLDDKEDLEDVNLFTLPCRRKTGKSTSFVSWETGNYIGERIKPRYIMQDVVKLAPPSIFQQMVLKRNAQDERESSSKKKKTMPVYQSDLHHRIIRISTEMDRRRRRAYKAAGVPPQVHVSTDDLFDVGTVEIVGGILTSLWYTMPSVAYEGCELKIDAHTWLSVSYHQLAHMCAVSNLTCNLVSGMRWNLASLVCNLHDWLVGEVDSRDFPLWLIEWLKVQEEIQAELEFACVEGVHHSKYTMRDSVARLVPENRRKEILLQRTLQGEDLWLENDNLQDNPCCEQVITTCKNSTVRYKHTVALKIFFFFRSFTTTTTNTFLTSISQNQGFVRKPKSGCACLRISK